MRTYKDKEILIFNTAWDLITERGYHETTMSHIAKAAGIGKGTIYGYFASKEELVVSMVIHNLETQRQRTLERMRGVDSAEDKLRIIAEADIEGALGLMRTMKLLQTLKSFDQCRVKEEVFELMREKYDLVEKIMEEGMALGDFNLKDPVHGALLFMGTMNNSLMHSHFGGVASPDPLEVLEFVLEKLKK